MDMLQFTRRRQLRWSALLVDILMWFIPLSGTGYRCKLVSSQSPETLSLSHFTCRSCQVQGSMDKLHRVSIVGEFLICCLNVTHRCTQALPIQLMAALLFSGAVVSR
jgi:hypothetical protein